MFMVRGAPASFALPRRALLCKSSPSMSAAARLRAFYFFYYAGVGVSLPYLAPYLKGLGLSGAEIGAVQMIGPLLSAPVGLSWAALADRLGTPARALRFVCAGALLVQLALPWAGSFWSFGAIMLGLGLFQPAVVPLVDTVTVESLATTGGNYARTRLFGSLGYVALAQGLGIALSARGDRPGDVLVPWAMLASVVAYALTSLLLPEPPARRPGAADEAGRAHPREALTLLADRRLRLLLAVSALHWAGCAPYNLLYGVLVREHGLPSQLTGLGSTAAVAAEVFVLFSAGAIEARATPRTLFALTFAATSLRWALLSRADSALGIVGLQLLHGLTFGLFWTTVIRSLSLYVPPRLRATGQALFGAVVFGAGNALGLQLAGWAYDRFGSVSPLFGWSAALELVPLAMILVLGRDRAR
jgi:PPP family 3-phenylpropionic acid transporter